MTLLVVLLVDDVRTPAYLIGGALARGAMVGLVLGLIARYTRPWKRWVLPVAAVAGITMLTLHNVASATEDARGVAGLGGASANGSSDGATTRLVAPTYLDDWGRIDDGRRSRLLTARLDRFEQTLPETEDVVGGLYGGPRGRLAYIGVNFTPGGSPHAELQAGPEATLRNFLKVPACPRSTRTRPAAPRSWDAAPRTRSSRARL